jgi:hypothetical protein
MNADSISMAIGFISALAIRLFTMIFDRAAYSATTEPTTSGFLTVTSTLRLLLQGLMVPVCAAIFSGVSRILKRLLLPESSVRVTLAYEHGQNYVSSR